MLKVNLLVLVVALSSPAAFAQKKKIRKKRKVQKTEETENGSESSNGSASLPPYGMAGCGVGAMVIEKNTMLPQIGAFLTNQYVSPQTSAITSGTSNCTDEPREVAMVEQEVFITANLNSLSKEAAQGSGSHLDALGEVMGCSEEGNNALKTLCKDRHEAIFNSDDSQMVLSTLRKEIQSNEKVANNCDRA